MPMFGEAKQTTILFLDTHYLILKYNNKLKDTF